MYKKIMVPLDGSELAECVMPHVKAFIEGFNPSEVVLVRVLDPVPLNAQMETLTSYQEYLTNVEEDRKKTATAYLKQVAEGLKQEKMFVQTEVLLGKVAESLIGCAESNNIDLIIIATHGRSGISRWIIGSVADKLLRSANVPVFMVRARGDKCEM